MPTKPTTYLNQLTEWEKAYGYFLSFETIHAAFDFWWEHLRKAERYARHSPHMRQLYKTERIRRHAGLPQKTKLRVTAQRKIIFID